MNQLLKQTLKFLLISLLFTSGGIFIIPHYFSENIKTSVISQIQQSLQSPLILDDVDFTIYENFPYASVKITNILVLESKAFENDTLLFAKSAYVKISLFDLMNKMYDIKSILISNAKINIKYNDFNTPNFLIFRKNSENKKPVSIERINLINTELTIKKSIPKTDIVWNLKNSTILINNQNYNLIANGKSKKTIVGAIDYMNAKQFNFTSNAIITKDSIRILNCNLGIENSSFKIKGVIYEGNSLNLEITAKEQEINNIIEHMPKHIQNICSPFVFNGKINFNSTLKGLVNKENNPLFDMKYEIKDGFFSLKSIPFKLQEIKMTGTLTNGKDRNFKSTKIISNLFNAKTKNGYINGEFTLTNLNNYFLKTNFKSSWDLQETNQYFKKSNFKGLKGRMFTNTHYEGNIAFDNRFKKRFLNAYHKSDIILENVKYNYKESPLNFTFESLNGKLNKQKILVNSSQITISETDFVFTGEILNLIAYTLKEAPKIYIDGNIKSTYTNFSEIMSLGDISSDNEKKISKSILPNWINTNTKFNIQNFSYNNFIASNLSGLISYKNGSLDAKNLNAQSLNGKIDGHFTLNEPINNNLKLTSNINFKKINIRNSFDAFNNYGQELITKEQLKGVGTAKLNIESHWGPNFVLDTKKLKLKSHLIIEKGELIDFKPLESLSSYVSLKELKHVKFSKLENTIDVADEVVTIPKMEIKSSALSLFLSGTHAFNQEINYEVTLLLSELLSNSFRIENTKITDFGEEKQDGEIFNTVYFKMTGKTDNPKISLNKIRFMEDINSGIKKEKEIIKNIIKEDVLQSKEKKIIEKGQEIEIDWAPEL